METQISFSNQEKYPRQGFMQRNALSVKIILIGVLILILLIPLAMIRGLILGTFRNRLGSNNGSTKQMEQLTIGNRPFHQYSLL